jgi:hypothetical protein
MGCNQSTISMWFGAWLAGMEFTFLSRRGAASWTTNSNDELEGQLLFHARIMP